MLAEAQTIEEVKVIRDKAETARKYAQCAMLGLETQNRCAEIKLQSERKAGNLLRELRLSSGRPGKKKWSRHATILKDLGINKSQSSRWQMEALVPEAVFQRYLVLAQEGGKEITTQGLLRLAQRERSAHGHDAGSDWDPVTKTPGGVGSPAVERIFQSNGISETRLSDETYSLVVELLDHRNLLADLLKPFCTQQSVRSERIQRRTVVRLLSEMEEALTALGIMLRGEDRGCRCITVGHRKHDSSSSSI